MSVFFEAEGSNRISIGLFGVPETGFRRRNKLNKSRLLMNGHTLQVPGIWILILSTGGC